MVKRPGQVMDVKKAENPGFTGVSGLLRIAPDSILVADG
jgi:hypothetical protein